MPRVDRNNPKRGSASESTFSLMEFEREFPDDATCLEWLKNYLYPDGIFCPKCEKVTTHYRVRSRPSYSCQFCGHHVHPTKGTIFENSATSLKLWFYAFYVMSSTRCGISAKALEREIGVTYKTAWRMFKQIRSILVQDDEPLFGRVEVDEGYFGGQGKWKHHKAGERVESNKTMVLGIAQRGDATIEKSPKISAQVVPPGDATLRKHVKRRVLPASVVFTDEHPAYWRLRTDYTHRRVNHQANVYVSGEVHTNTIEGFWSLVKRGISGTYHNVSTKYLQTYLYEYVFRYNNREATGRGMMDAFLNRIEKASDS
jgi:transposase-like protein